ncbi:MFS transporter [Prauserella alba]|uniref:MFS transporter n=1 Tax=Prauserella alba TaxID=176898 RepID=A0ABN1VDL8_9PSEU|nr:MFS transporter [Prauserella alba]MCP2182439.1 Sugar phosphate permease [Prauserella alba]
MMRSNHDSPYRWVVLLLCWAAFTMTSVDRSTWGPASAAVSDSLNVPLAALGIFATCYYIGYVVANAAGGFCSDWLGGRLTLGVTSLVAGGLMMLFGSTTSIGVGLAIQAALGLFAGADFSAGLKLVAAWFRPEARGFAAGVFMTATSLGTVVANAVVPGLIVNSGWETSYHLFGAVTIVIAILCLAFIRNGQHDGTSETPARRAVPDVRPLRRNRDLLFLGLAGFGGLWGTYGFITWSNTLMVRGNGIDPVDAGVVVVIFAGVAIAVKPLVGIVTDRLGTGRRIPIAIILAAFGATLLVFGTLDSYTAFLWVAPVLGLTAYAYSPLTAAMTPTLVGQHLTGSAAGVVNAFWQLGSVAVPAVVGPVFQVTDSFYAAFVTLAVGPLIGAAVMLCVRDDRPRNAVETPAARSNAA